MDIEPVSSEEPELGNTIADALADGERALSAGVGQHQRELVAAEPRDDVGFARAAANDRRRFYQRPAAEEMPVGVVDRLEPVEIDEEQGKRTAAARRALGFAAEHLVQKPGVVETRE